VSNPWWTKGATRKLEKTQNRQDASHFSLHDKLKQSDPSTRSLCSELKELVGFYPVCFIGNFSSEL
jgi:hypothetical protein